MSQLTSRSFLIALTILGTLLNGCAGGSNDERRPNVVLIIVDTLRADSVDDPNGYYDTPALDALAADGVKFPLAFAHAPMTLPSHTSLFSSRPPLQTKIVNNGQKVPESLPLLSEWISKYGYESRAVASLGTLTPAPKARPGLGRGFVSYDVDFWNLDPAERVIQRIESSLDEWDTDRPLFFFGHFCDPHEPYDSHQDTGRYASISLDGESVGRVSTENMSMYEQTVSLRPGRNEFEITGPHRFRLRYLTVRENGQALDLSWEQGKMQTPGDVFRFHVDRSSDATAECELTLWANDVLTPEQIRERYVGEVAHVDRYVGQVIDQLKERGIYDQSLVIFTSDHGEALGEHGAIGHVQNLTDDMIRVPLIIKAPKGSKYEGELAGLASNLIRHVDIVPTILELVGVPDLPGQTGTSIFAGEDVVHIAQTHKPEAKKDKISLRDKRFKMIYTLDDDSFRMFDVENDPYELKDVFAARRNERADWPERLRSLAKATTSLGGAAEVDEETRRQLQALGYN